MAQRFEGKNLEDALNSAAQTFGVERYQLTYHVLMEKRGFLGGMKRIVMPVARARSMTSGVFNASDAAAVSFSTTGRGVPAGAKSAIQASSTNDG